MADGSKFTTGDVAKYLNLSTSRVDQLEKTGRLRAERTVSGIRIFRRKDVEAFARSRKWERRGAVVGSWPRRKPPGEAA